MARIKGFECYEDTSQRIGGLRMGARFSKPRALHGVAEAFACFASKRCVKRDVLKTSPPWMAHDSHKGF